MSSSEETDNNSSADEQDDGERVSKVYNTDRALRPPFYLVWDRAITLSSHTNSTSTLCCVLRWMNKYYRILGRTILINANPKADEEEEFRSVGRLRGFNLTTKSMHVLHFASSLSLIVITKIFCNLVINNIFFMNLIFKNKNHFRQKSGLSYQHYHLKNCKNWKRKLVPRCIKKHCLVMSTKQRSVNTQKFSKEKIRTDLGRWAPKNQFECYRLFLQWRKKKFGIQGTVIFQHTLLIILHFSG